MKPAIQPELQAKFLQHLNNRKNRADEGFTLIELLVVVIIIGVKPSSQKLEITLVQLTALNKLTSWNIKPFQLILLS
jgi:prepilin-type N-terminal cleavage/methylation domain-containing protein